MSSFPDNDSSVTLDRREHNSDAIAKRVLLRAQDVDSGDWVNIAAADNGDGSFSLSVTPASKIQPSTSNVTTVADTSTSTAIKVANLDRKEIEIINTSSAVLYLLKGSGTASSANFTVRLEQFDYYTTDYTGQINGVWASDPDDGSAIITESE